MTEFLTYFSNREIALFVWIFILIVAMSISKSIRKSMGRVLKIFFSKTILTTFALFILYASIVVFGLQKIGFWDWSLLKDTIFWTFGFAIVLVFRANKTKRISDFKTILKDAVKWTIVVEFLVAFYTFSLNTELIILPILFFIGMLQAYSDTDTKYSQVSKLLKTVSSLTGLVILGYVTYKTFYQGGELISIGNFKSLILPIILTALFIPFVYLLSVFMIYEETFVNLKIFIKDDKLRKHLKRQTLKIAKLNLDKLSNISENIIKERPYTLEDSFEKIKNMSDRKQKLLNR